MTLEGVWRSVQRLKQRVRHHFEQPSFVTVPWCMFCAKPMGTVHTDECPLKGKP